jgi:hypothetical protein
VEGGSNDDIQRFISLKLNRLVLFTVGLQRVLKKKEKSKKRIESFCRSVKNSLKDKAKRWDLGSLQLANGYASVKTSLAIARARAQEMKFSFVQSNPSFYTLGGR